jgi:hypothetical protein
MKLIANSMKNQIFVAIGVAIVASVLVTGLASTIHAQSNMTGVTSTDGGGDGGDGDDGGEGDGDGNGGDDGDGSDESN